MDELISKLRHSQRAAPSQAEPETPRENPRPPVPSTDKPASIPTDDDPSTTILLDDLPTSQCEHRGANLKMDFDRLVRYRAPGAMWVSEALGTPSHRLDRPLYVFVKSVDFFSQSLARWVLCDETGVLSGTADVPRGRVMAGQIVALEGCGIWKFEENHLNIVSENIRDVFG